MKVRSPQARTHQAVYAKSTTYRQAARTISNSCGFQKDHLALYGVKNALLAPGYRSPDSQNIMGKAD
ncbi:hypothetical protein AFE_1416 [Acidithiobacillus ferrooxidans ATCC 23270]|uniref:Uncharacterized protein n=1 Tax=Acidithiobacillus ferrooxidans (strain ATCC 23270 / DSM 14882 / CIP 104768 / NCIMB 8455) TaxID=243159 RepID=B7J9L4_ACIF2|nr:hypothetical protein AFE_1416 [Acidithiobacillus ferrooxidans ATCC 23270]